MSVTDVPLNKPDSLGGIQCDIEVYTPPLHCCLQFNPFTPPPPPSFLPSLVAALFGFAAYPLLMWARDSGCLRFSPDPGLPEVPLIDDELDVDPAGVGEAQGEEEGEGDRERADEGEGSWHRLGLSFGSKRGDSTGSAPEGEGEGEEVEGSASKLSDSDGSSRRGVLGLLWPQVDGWRDREGSGEGSGARGSAADSEQQGLLEEAGRSPLRESS